MKIVIDTLGSDNGAKDIIDACVEIYNLKKIQFVFVGEEKFLEKQLENKIEPKDYEIINSLETISNDEDPVRAIRKKKKSSMVMAFNRLNDSDCDGLISCGSTGALLSCGIFITGRIKSIKRATLAASIPTLKGNSLLVDSGANVDCKSEFLRDFAIMGDIYSKFVFDNKKPRIGLLNIGVESHKGNKLSKETYKLLKNEKRIDFIGNIEARDILNGTADVIVADGFDGNIALKSAEGMAVAILNQLKSALKSSAKTKFAALLFKSELKNSLKVFDYKEVGGAPLLGVNKAVFKAHGNSDKRAFKNALLLLIDYIEKDVISYLKEELCLEKNL
ncbi:MAG: phosphate acyltransferase PlsX [Tissierellia bacterium]|nr:phosphate acyltransferase PlsX [Tissierellia bacterium]